MAQRFTTITKLFGNLRNKTFAPGKEFILH
ncbi:hypothetical protein NTGHW29_280041 [Candidatus Nitrotoga sp. HW29]|nr:hypothetical protein NTGHW29_280041 [Candidatus Nitrotoga sp. HW29]